MFGSPSLSDFTADRFLEVLADETTGPVPEDRDRLTVVSIAGGKASGRLVDGCLLDFIFTIGTPWEPDLDGANFFVEDTGSAPIQIDRALLYLHQIGKLDKVRGIVVGELAGCEWDNFTTAPRSKTLEDVLTGRLGGLGVPVLQPPARPRCEPRHPSTRRAGHCGRGFADAHDRRARASFGLERKFSGGDRLFLIGGAFPAWFLNPLEGQAGLFSH
jgi:LD-carboxypeptidase C-terminal domain